MKCFLHLRPSSSLLFAKRAASLQMRQFGVTITQSSGSGSGSEAGPGSGSSLLEAAAALEMVRLGRSPPVQFVDASWFMGDTGKGLADFQQGERLPGAVFFDIDQVAAAASVPTADSDAAPDADAAAAAAPPLPHMLPSPEDFAAHMTALGVSNTRPVVVYNQPGCFSAARCWWTFKVFGHPAPVWVLNGGVKAWKEAGGEVERGSPTSSSGRDAPPPYSLPSSSPSPSPPSGQLVADKQAVLVAMSSGMRQIVDARSADRFLGRVPEPRAGLEGGHIPGSLHLAFPDVLEEKEQGGGGGGEGGSSRFKGWRELRRVFEEAGVVAGSEVIFTCGSGVTAAVLALARAHSGAEERMSAVYDGSWSEWGSDPNTPKMKEEGSELGK